MRRSVTKAHLNHYISIVSEKASHAYRQAMGWAKKSTASQRTSFTSTQKSYLTAKLKLREQTGSKTDPAVVAQSMMCAKDSTGSRLFTSDNFLTATQIAGFSSCLSSKKALANDEPHTDIAVAAYKVGAEELVREDKCEFALNIRLFTTL